MQMDSKCEKLRLPNPSPRQNSQIPPKTTTSYNNLYRDLDFPPRLIDRDVSNRRWGVNRAWDRKLAAPFSINISGTEWTQWSDASCQMNDYIDFVRS